jgi:hypothetical protein
VSELFGEEQEDAVAPRRERLVYAPTITQPDGQIWPRDWAEKTMAEVSSFQGQGRRPGRRPGPGLGLPSPGAA